MADIAIRFPIAAHLDKETPDGRTILSSGFSTEYDGPQRIWVKDTQSIFGGHDGAFVAGEVSSWEINEGVVSAEGYLINDEQGVGKRVARLVHSGLLKGASIDLEDVAFEGTDVFDEDGWSYKIRFTSSTAAGLTLCTDPAFADAYAELIDASILDDQDTADEDEEDDDEEEDALVASAGEFTPIRVHSSYQPVQTITYSRELFDNPNLERLTGPRYDAKTGRVTSYIAGWGQCHLGMTHTCVVAPKSQTGYSMFHRQPIQTDKGSLMVGVLVCETTHAKNRGITAEQAMSHYSDTGSVWAIGRAGEDETGIWFSGVVAPGVSPELLTKALSTQLSGDWRPFRGLPNRELIAALSVPVPGFPAFSSADDPGAALVLTGPEPDPSPDVRLMTLAERLDERLSRFEAWQKRQEDEAAEQVRMAKLSALRNRVTV